ncbi:MAG: chaperone modulator CbpM [Chitinophagaceae bacterium]|nr:chaperone modulator CbpM [Chitinophagaceae bacterium]MCB9045713.1 chaperone modulator CbpM [Chitinophagales bacterium]
MEKAELIPASDFCTHYSISFHFVEELQEAGLIEVVNFEEQTYIHPDHIATMERLARLHTDLDINMEGIAAIAQLLQQVEDLQEQLRSMSARLSIYETD